MATDFTLYSDDEIVDFLDANFDMFASERSDDFPVHLTEGLARGDVFIVRCREGFAVVYRGRHRHFTNSSGHVPADLLFLHVAAEFEGKGIGSKLLANVKSSVTPRSARPVAIA